MGKAGSWGSNLCVEVRALLYLQLLAKRKSLRKTGGPAGNCPARLVFGAPASQSWRPGVQVFHRMDELMRSREGLSELEVLRRECEGGERGLWVPEACLSACRAGGRAVLACMLSSAQRRCRQSGVVSRGMRGVCTKRWQGATSAMLGCSRGLVLVARAAAAPCPALLVTVGPAPLQASLARAKGRAKARARTRTTCSASWCSCSECRPDRMAVGRWVPGTACC